MFFWAKTFPQWHKKYCAYSSSCAVPIDVRQMHLLFILPLIYPQKNSNCLEQTAYIHTPAHTHTHTPFHLLPLSRPSLHPSSPLYGTDISFAFLKVTTPGSEGGIVKDPGDEFWAGRGGVLFKSAMHHCQGVRLHTNTHTHIRTYAQTDTGNAHARREQRKAARVANWSWPPVPFHQMSPEWATQPHLFCTRAHTEAVISLVSSLVKSQLT